MPEVERSNPEIAPSLHTWRAATNLPKQASALPETQITFQQFSVGSPRPSAGFSNSDFAYVGIGASQDLPHPGKRRLRSEVAAREAEMHSIVRPTVSWVEISHRIAKLDDRDLRGAFISVHLEGGVGRPVRPLLHKFS